MKLQQQLGDGVGRRAIEVAGWLVAKKHGRIKDERSRHGGALLLASRQLGGAMIETIAEANLFQQLACTLDSSSRVVPS